MGSPYTCAVDQVVDVTEEELNRLSFDAVSDLGLIIQNGPWTGTEGTVIEKGNLRVKAPIC